MLNYQSSFAPSVASPAQGFAKGSPFKAFNQNHRDVLAGLTARNAAAFNMNSAKAAAEDMAARDRMTDALSLRGLQQLAQFRRADSEMQMSRLRSYSDLLQGLYS